MHIHHRSESASVCSVCASIGKISICVQTHRLSFHKNFVALYFFLKTLSRGKMNFLNFDFESRAKTLAEPAERLELLIFVKCPYELRALQRFFFKCGSAFGGFSGSSSKAHGDRFTYLVLFALNFTTPKIHSKSFALKR